MCTPTRGTVLTGRNHNRYCLWKANTPGKGCRLREDFLCPSQVFLPHSEITVAEILRDEGYRTAVFGKWHLGDLKQLPNGLTPSSPEHNGFDVWKVTERSVPTSTPNCACFNTSLCNLGHYYKAGPPSCTNYHTTNGHPTSHKLTAHNEPILKDDSDFIVDMFEKFLQDSVSGQSPKPFFVYLPLHGVHKRYIATSPYDSLYESKPGLTQNQVDYYAAITAVDSAVGRVRRLLREYNVSDNTMLWFTSDNGPAHNTPGDTGGLRDRKGSVYEGGIRVPGIIEFPALIKSNIVSDVPAVTSDFLPTVCDVLNVQAPVDRPIDGVSLLSVLTEQVQTRNQTIKWAYNIQGDFDGRYKGAILDGKYKLVADYKKGKLQKAALYDVTNKKGEDTKKNFFFDKDDMDAYKRLTRELEDWRQSVIHSATNEVCCL